MGLFCEGVQIASEPNTQVPRRKESLERYQRNGVCMSFICYDHICLIRESGKSPSETRSSTTLLVT